ncbi:DUF3810 family protein [Faecalibacter rhinopitheci]|uniref:DUF3810 family protein n=1 Tax=Faecalibacter rhinopitheci TaxID=2779678 RepID=A0A8J7FPW5_9FLAO|nr:DUF3810 family protein [Faecalibacter rhinopitheci]MBF0595873.1 DUF3810 family protein [Faecalibacter rhinopitheci]
MLKKWSSWGIIFFVQIVWWTFLHNFDTLNSVWFNVITANYNQVIYHLSAKISWPIGEFLYLSVIIILLSWIYKCIKVRTISYFLKSSFIILSCILFLYKSVWGITYYKDNFKIDKPKYIIEVDNLKLLYCSTLSKSILDRNSLQLNEKEYVKFNFSEVDYLNDFQKNQYLLQQEKWINNYIIIEQPVVKHSYISNLLNYSGILGYYNPFTIESNINFHNTQLKTPSTIFHELAHQMGFASESEANFIAYYLGSKSNLAEVRYAVNYKLIFSLLSEISKYDSQFVKKEMENLPLGIKTDREYELSYYTQFDGKTNEIFSNFNDQFLKANNQEGTISYSKYIELVYYYHFIK